MYLYNLTLQRAGSITAAIYGNFSAPKIQEIVVSRGKVLELLRPDENGKVQVVYSTEVFGIIRSLQPFRFPGSQQDYIIAGSDSGRIIILQYSKDKNSFIKIHQETFGKSGCRRIVPGEYLAVDPKGRACLIGALEKQKFVYILNRDNEARLTISSPLEAHKSHHILFDVVGMDMGFDNPQFAAIELDYGDVDADPTGEAAADAEKQLVIYELDLGLNTVIRKHSEPIDTGANKLIAVPGVADGGPGGVIVCCENFLLYRNMEHPELRAVIPRRTDLPGDRSVLITTVAMLKQKSRFFIFVQSDCGDIYKVTLDFEGDSVNELKIKYFDTIPPASAICIMRKGFFFSASEFGDHGLYQFVGLGDDDAVESSSATLVKASMMEVDGSVSERNGVGARGVDDEDEDEGYVPVFFEPRSPPVNLEMIDRIESLHPVLDMKVANLLNEEIPQIYAACGRGSQSTLRVLRPGLAVTEMAVSPVPGAPTGAWTLRASSSDEHDAFIIISFANATLVLKIGDTVEQADNTGFAGNIQTLCAQWLADESLLQVTPTGMRHIRPDGRVNEWRAPGRRSVTRAATNERQAAIVLSGGEVVYFELSVQGTLVEMERKELGGDISAIDVAPLVEGRQRSRFLAVGLYDGAVRLLSLDPGDGLRSLGTQIMGSIPDSILLLESRGGVGEGAGTLFLQAGLNNGVLARTEIDPVTGQMTDTRTRFLGVRSPTLARVKVRGAQAMLALSTRPWLGYSVRGKFNLAPLSYGQLDYAASFSTEDCPEGFVAVAKNSLRIITIERLGEFFNQQKLRLRYTPRKMIIHPDHNVILTIEADSQTIPLSQQHQSTTATTITADHPGNGSSAEHSIQGPEMEESTALRAELLGLARGHPGQWASCIRLVDPSSLSTLHCLELDNNEAALSVAIAGFESSPELGALICIGTAKGLKFNPREHECGFIRVYKISADGKSLEFIHSTEVDAAPRAMASYRGRLLVGIGRVLRMYELGKKRLLKKCEYRSLPSEIATIDVHGHRIILGDAQDSFHFMKYKKMENTFYVFADDTIPRHVTAAVPLDYDSVAGGDRFGNMFVLRVPPEVSAAIEEDPTAGKYAGELGVVGGAPNRLHAVANFHVGETITSVQKAVLQGGGREVLLYATVQGTLGVLCPFVSRSDVDFFQHLEMHMRQEAPPLLGRDHLAYRSAYVPVKDVLDGDLCAQFCGLPFEKQKGIASELDRGVGEVLKRLEDVSKSII